MVNNTRVGGHLYGFVIDLENSLGYSIKFIHGIRGTGGEGWEGVCICVLGWTKVLKGMHRVETHSRSFPNECRGAQRPVAVLEFRGEFNYPRAFDAIILHDITP